MTHAVANDQDGYRIQLGCACLADTSAGQLSLLVERLQTEGLIGFDNASLMRVAMLSAKGA